MTKYYVYMQQQSNINPYMQQNLLCVLNVGLTNFFFLNTLSSGHLSFFVNNTQFLFLKDE